MKVNSIEILAPSGDFASLKAAIKAGANAIYLGGELFSARAKAKNFNMKELELAVDYAHLRGVKLYVTTNIILDNSEIRQAVEFVKFLYNINIDGVIVQDIGFGLILREIFKDMEIHASTQMAVNNLWGAKTIENFGFQRLVLARETSLEEVSLIKNNTNLDIEAFVHGALCVCFSGECLMSSMIGARSGNRGDCAQPCRKPYKIVSLDGKLISDSKYFISPKDLNTLLSVDDLVKAGVYSLKIEGRMKKPEYVYTIVKNYKKAIEDTLTKEDEIETEEIFSRGFTKGLFGGDFGKTFINEDRPSNHGRKIGKVLSKEKKGFIIDLDSEIKSGDGIEFYRPNFSYGFFSKEDIKSGKSFFESNKNLKGAIIYKTFSKELDEKIKNSLNQEATYKELSIRADLFINKKAKIYLQANEKSSEFELDEKIEEAKKVPISQADIRDSLSKLGGTVYELSEIEINMDENIFIPKSSLNKLRREAINLLDQEFLKFNRKEVSLEESIYRLDNINKKATYKLNVEVDNIKNLKEIDLTKVNRIYYSVDYIDRELIQYLKDKNIKISGILKKFQSTKELLESYNTVKSNIDIFESVAINNLSGISLFKDLKIKKIADIGLNVFNSYTIRELRKYGIDEFILSPELNKNQIIEIADNYSQIIEVVSHGFIPVMTMPHCPTSLIVGCVDSKNCNNCKYAKGFYLEDEREQKFLVKRHKNISEIFNSHPIMLSDKIKYFMSKNVKSYKLYLRDDIKETINLYRNILDKKDFNDETLRESLIKKYQSVTYGHYNRGVK